MCVLPLHFKTFNENSAFCFVFFLSNVAVMPFPQRFTGESIIIWSDLDITISVPWYIGLMFRTRKVNGMLMQANAGVSSKINIQVDWFNTAPNLNMYTVLSHKAQSNTCLLRSSSNSVTRGLSPSMLTPGSSLCS